MNKLMIKSSTAIAAALTIFATSLPMEDANAASVRVKCVKGANSSKVSVDGRGLPSGSYRARIISGDNAKRSPLVAGAGEIEFDFDSDAGNIAAGATAISSNFIQGNKVTGQIKDSKGFTVATATSVCTAK